LARAFVVVINGVKLGLAAFPAEELLARASTACKRLANYAFRVAAMREKLAH
jgi:hypothetical protein